MTSTITEERLHEILIENERKLIEDLRIPELITEYKVVKQRPSYRRAGFRGFFNVKVCSAVK